MVHLSLLQRMVHLSLLQLLQIYSGSVADIHESFEEHMSLLQIYEIVRMVHLSAKETHRSARDMYIYKRGIFICKRALYVRKRALCLYEAGSDEEHGDTHGTGWRRCRGYLKLQVFFRKRATNHRALLQKKIYKDKASCASSPHCIYICRCIQMYVHLSAQEPYISAKKRYISYICVWCNVNMYPIYAYILYMCMV